MPFSKKTVLLQRAQMITSKSFDLQIKFLTANQLSNFHIDKFSNWFYPLMNKALIICGIMLGFSRNRRVE